MALLLVTHRFGKPKAILARSQGASKCHCGWDVLRDTETCALPLPIRHAILARPSDGATAM